MSSELFIHGTIRFGSSSTAAPSLQTFNETNNHTSSTPNVYVNGAALVVSSVTDATVNAASSLTDAVINATSSVAAAVMPSDINQFQASPGFPGGDPGGGAICSLGNMTIDSAISKKIPLRVISSISELGSNTNFLYGFSSTLVGTAVVASVFFLGRALYRGYKRYQSLKTASNLSQEREKLLQTLIERQALINQRSFKERCKPHPQDLLNLQYLNKRLAEKKA